jgi:hypothetical protein
VIEGWLMAPAPRRAGVAGRLAAGTRRGQAAQPLLRRLPMVLDAGSRFLVARHDLAQARIAPDPDAPAARALRDGEARLAIGDFAFTANNVTYAALGAAMNYWAFFPSEDADWGCIPVWGFATVTESRADGVAVGTRVYGYLPMGSHLVVQPARAGAGGFADAAPHRQALPAAYQQYTACAADPLHDPAREAQQALLRPLFATSFLIDDFLAEHAFHGAGRVLLSSASSKTAYGTAFCIARRAERPRLVGLTSERNLGFVRALGCYDDVLAYESLPALDATLPTTYVDFAGSAPLRARVHAHLGARLAYSCAVGGTRHQELGGGLGGTGAVLFFAPTQYTRRRAEWGAEGFGRRFGAAWQAFVDRVDDAAAPWLVVRRARGAAAVEQTYRQLLGGEGDPRDGWMLAL